LPQASHAYHNPGEVSTAAAVVVVVAGVRRRSGVAAWQAEPGSRLEDQTASTETQGQGL